MARIRGSADAPKLSYLSPSDSGLLLSPTPALSPSSSSTLAGHKIFGSRFVDGNATANSVATTFTRKFHSASPSHYSLTPSSQINQSDFTKMAWKGIVAAVDDALENKQAVGSKHLMKALLKQDGLARRIFSEAGLDNASILQATVKFKSRLSKVKGETSEAIFCKHLCLLLDNARTQKKNLGDNFVSVEHLVLAFHSDKRFGQQLFKKLQLSKKGLKDAVQAVRGNHKVTDQYPEVTYEALDNYVTDLTELAKRGKLDPIIGRNGIMQRCIQILLEGRKTIPIIIGERGVGKTAVVEGLAQRIVRGDVPESLWNRKLISLDMGLLVADAKYHGDFEDRLKVVLKEVGVSNGQNILFIDEIHTVVDAGATGDGAMNAGNLLKSILDRGELWCIGATTLKDYEKYIEKDPTLEQRFQQVFCSQLSVEDTISVLRGLREEYERHHGVKISDKALVSAVVLADKYIRDRFFPNKAIDLVEEAAAKFKMEITDMPAELNEIDRAISRLEIEKFSLRNDTDEASKTRSSKLEQDLISLQQKYKELTEQWDREESLVTRIQFINEAIERKLNLKDRAAKSKCGTLISLHRQLKETTRSLHDCQKRRISLLQEEVSDLDIAEVVSNWTGMPLSNLQQYERDKLVLLEQVLNQKVVGQDIAIRLVVDVIRRSRGLSNPNRPIAVFLLLGPTGVGKSEFAKALAGYFFNTEDALVKIYMSDYTEKHAISRLIGAPPGYVGYEVGGQLTELVRRKSHSVVLFDKIEMAHNNVFNILLQLLSDGRITDSGGRTVSFANCIIIMTSNIGSDCILETHGKMKDSKDVIYELIKNQVVGLARQIFGLEFMNQIDKHVVFQPLNSTQMCKIAEIQIKRVRDRLKQMNINLQYTKEALELIGALKFDPRDGAWPVKRVIEELLEDEVATEIMRGNFKGGDSIIVDVDASLSAKERWSIKKIDSSSTSDVIVVDD